METPSENNKAEKVERKRRGWAYWLRRVAVVVVVTYVGFCMIACGLQTQLFFPGAASQGRPEAVVMPSKGSELLKLATPKGETVAAVFGWALNERGKEIADAAKRPTVIYFYGNGMCMADAMGEFEDFRRLGLNVIVPDYLGYGMSTGKPGEQSCYDAADACWAYVKGRKELEGSKIIVSGWSLGGAVAIDLASRHPGEVAGVMTFSAFTSAADMASHLYPFLPVRLLLGFKFESDKKIGKISCPILLGHGRKDSLVPAGMLEKLASAARKNNPQVTTFVIEGAEHNDFFAGGPEVMGRIGAFVGEVK